LLDWKKKVDRIWKQRRLISKKRTEERKINKLSVVGYTFICHVCGKPSEKTKGESLPQENIDLSTPGDLFRCKICEKWTCSEHIYKGICKICAESI